MSTEYVLLENEGGESENWSVLGKISARSSKAAVRAHMEKTPNTQVGGEFVAVPARSWQPIKVAVETALKFS